MLKTLLQMTRPVNIAIAIVTLIVGYYLLGELPGSIVGVSVAALALQSLGFAFAIGFANIQNDIFDYQSDKQNRPERPLPSGRISMKAAKVSWIIMMALSIACGIGSSLIGGEITSSIFFMALSILLVAYNKFLKHIPLLKNMTVAFLCMTPLILNLLIPVGISESDIDALDGLTKLGLLYPAMLFAFLLTTAREIYKDLEDETGDLTAGIMTFPLIAGAPTARRLAGALLTFTWILLSLPVMQGFYPTLFLILTLATLTPSFIYIMVQANKRNYHKAQSITKLAMFAGLVSLVISVSV